MTHTVPMTEREIRYFCQGERIVLEPITNENNEIIDYIEMTLTEDDLEIIIMNMKQTNLPFTSELFKQVQKLYILAKTELSNNKSVIPGKKRILRPA